MSLFRRVRPAAVLALGVLVTGPLLAVSAAAPVGDDLACRVDGQITVGKDGWARIKSPDYADRQGKDEIVDLAAPERERGRLYVTNGKLILASVDNGCTWEHIAGDDRPLEFAPVAPDDQARTDVYSHLVAPTTRALWVASYDETDGASRPHTYYTPNATPAPGNTSEDPFVTVDVGLPPVGRILDLEVSPRDVRTAYALIEELPDPRTGDALTPARKLYRTVVNREAEQVGLPELSWEQVTLPPGLGRLDGITVAPTGTRQVWAWSGTKFALTTTGGVPLEGVPAWSAAQTAPGPVTTVNINSFNFTTVWGTTPQGGFALLVADGKVVDTRSVPGTPTAVANGTRVNVYAVSGKDGTYGFDLRTQTWVNLTPKDVGPLANLSMVRGGVNRIMLGHTATTIYRFDLWAPELFIAPPHVGYIRGLDPNIIPTLPGADFDGVLLTPRKAEVTLQPGQTADVPVTMAVAPDTTKLDVYFLMDTTSSMANSIKGLRDGMQKIARTLGRVNPNACFGVGEFKDVTAAAPPTAGEPNPEPHRVYRVRQPVDECNLEKVIDTLSKLRDAGGLDEPEAHTMALVQALRGNGQPPYVDADQDAKFRPGAYKVVVLITDASMHREEPTYPSMSDTIDLLNEYDVNVVGVVAENVYNDTDKAFDDLAEIAGGTGTVAPPSGVDCDKDGLLDIQPAEPLVCRFDNTPPNIEPAITNLLLSVKDPGTVKVDVLGNDMSVVAKVNGDTEKLVNLKLLTGLSFTVTVTCLQEHDGQDVPLHLIGSVRAKPRAIGEIVVKCRGIPIIPPPPEPPPPPVRVIREIIPPPVIPPPPLVFNVQPPNNPIPNANPNAGFAQQEEQQFQLATVSQGNAEEQEQEEEATELAMSALDRDDPAAAPLFIGSAMLTSMAGAYAVQQRRRSQQALRPAYARRRRR